MSTKQIKLLYSINMPAEEALDIAEDEIRDLHGRALLLSTFETALQRADALCESVSEARSLGDYVEAKKLEQEFKSLLGSIQKTKDMQNKIAKTPFMKNQGFSLDWLPFKTFGDLVLRYRSSSPAQKPPQAFWKPCSDNQFRLLVNISQYSDKAFVVSTWTFFPNGSNSKLQIDASIPKDHPELSSLPLQKVETIFEDNAIDTLRFLVDFAYNRTFNETATELLSGDE